MVTSSLQERDRGITFCAGAFLRHWVILLENEGIVKEMGVLRTIRIEEPKVFKLYAEKGAHQNLWLYIGEGRVEARSCSFEMRGSY